MQQQISHYRIIGRESKTQEKRRRLRKYQHEATKGTVHVWEAYSTTGTRLDPWQLHSALRFLPLRNFIASPDRQTRMKIGTEMGVWWRSITYSSIYLTGVKIRANISHNVGCPAQRRTLPFLPAINFFGNLPNLLQRDTLM